MVNIDSATYNKHSDMFFSPREWFINVYWFEREKDWCEKETSISSLPYPTGDWTCNLSWLEIKLATCLVQQIETPGQGEAEKFLKSLLRTHKRCEYTVKKAETCSIVPTTV